MPTVCLQLNVEIISLKSHSKLASRPGRRFVLIAALCENQHFSIKKVFFRIEITELRNRIVHRTLADCFFLTKWPNYYSKTAFET